MMLQRIKLLIGARVPVAWLVSHEEARVEANLARLAMGMKYQDTPGQCAVWSLTGNDEGGPGWCQPDDWKGEELPADFAPDPMLAASEHGALLQAIRYAQGNAFAPTILIVRDAHTFTGSDPWRRAVRDAARRLRDTLTTLVLVSCESELPRDIRADVTLVRPGLPDRVVLRKQSESTLSRLGIGGEVDAQQCADALRGLGVREASDAMMLDYTEHKGIDPVRLSRIKAEELARVPGISFEGEVEDIGNVGGLENLKAALEDFADGFSGEAEAFGLDQPKGFLLVGVPGCGKTLTSRAAASVLGLPLIALDPSACEGSLVGETAERVRTALETVDALSPCVLRVDEIEKALGAGGELDGGSKETLRRALLIWLEDRKSQVFVVATANNVTMLPPEMKRVGRWDATFSVDLPHDGERDAIVRVHLARRKRTLADEEIATLVQKSKDMTGAEIVACIKRGLRHAFRDGRREMTAADVGNAMDAMVPQSNGDQIKALRAWATQNAMPASAAPARASSNGKRRAKAKQKVSAPTGPANLWEDDAPEA
jgi:hypothetical protein